MAMLHVAQSVLHTHLARFSRVLLYLLMRVSPLSLFNTGRRCTFFVQGQPSFLGRAASAVSHRTTASNTGARSFVFGSSRLHGSPNRPYFSRGQEQQQAAAA
eukprot:scaffold27295_cov21-Tisochrysis_lutea.AAC.1